MKQLLFILFFFNSFNLFSQAPLRTDTALLQMDKKLINAGKELKKASSHMVIGVVLNIVGVGVMFAGNVIYNEPTTPVSSSSIAIIKYNNDLKQYNRNMNVFRIAGAGIAVLGFGVTLEGFNKIGKAGFRLSSQ